MHVPIYIELQKSLESNIGPNFPKLINTSIFDIQAPVT